MKKRNDKFTIFCVVEIFKIEKVKILFFRRKDWREKSIWRNRIRFVLKTLVWIFLAFSFSYFFLETIQNVKPQKIEPSVSSIIDIDEIAVIDNQLEPFQTAMPKKEILPNGVEAFLYSNDDNVQIIKNEKVNVKLAEQQFDLPPQADEEVHTINDVDMEKIEDTYEEELPEDVFEDELPEVDDAEIIRQEGEGYHINREHKTIQEIGVLPQTKPWYFGEKPVIAIVIDDMGVSQRHTKEITSLHSPITSSFLTYARQLPEQVEAAKAAGHEIMLHVPMQAKTNKDAAPDVLLASMAPEEIKSRLQVMLTKVLGISGINNHMGSLFTENAQSLGAVMEVLHEHNLFFLDSKTSAQSVGRQQAKLHDVVYTHRHVFLDNENNVDYINKQLGLAEDIARRNHYVVAIGHPKSGTYQALKEWLPQVEARGFKLVKMSEIADVIGVPQ